MIYCIYESLKSSNSYALWGAQHTSDRWSKFEDFVLKDFPSRIKKDIFILMYFQK